MKTMKGFTLIELVIVIILLGIIAAVAVPKFMDITDEAKKNATKAAVASVRSAVNIYYANATLKNKTNKYPTTEAMLRGLIQGGFPKNPMNGLDTIQTTTSAIGTTDGTTGWRYNATSGNAGFGQFWSNTWTAAIHANAY